MVPGAPGLAHAGVEPCVRPVADELGKGTTLDHLQAPYAYFWIVAITNIDAVARDLMFGFAAAVGQIQNDGFAIAFFAVVFVEDGFGDYILFAGPISQVAFAAAFAAKGKIRMYRRVRGGFTYRAFVFHMVLPGL